MKMNLFHFQLIAIISLLSLINYVFLGTRQIIQSTASKYENSEFLNFFRVPKNYISSISSPCSKSAEIGKAFDNNFNNYWLSAQEGTKCIDSDSGAIYTSLKVNITVKFTKTVFIKNMIYQAYSTSTDLGIGYPETLKVYYSTETGKNAKFTLIDTISSTVTDKKVVFTFTNIIKCNQINIRWEKIHSSTTYPKKATAKELIFLYPETAFLNNTILNTYDKSDYKQLTLTKAFNNLQNLNYMKADLSLYGYNDYMKEYLNRISSLISGSLKYDAKREFSTNSNSKVRMIYQRGDIEKYAKNTLKMAHAGTNRQSMGIYGRSNEKITFYVKASKSTDPMPKIKFAQFIGSWGKWLSKEYNLKVGKNTFFVDNFTLIEWDTTPTIPGGPIYIINPYTSKEQGEISVYVEGGTVFPSFRIGDNEEDYKTQLLNCINLNKKNNKTYFDITELMSDNAMITLKASDAYKIYSDKNNKGPKKNMEEWDSFLKKLYAFDGLQFSTTQPYYNELNKYINIHYQYVQILKGAAAFATDQYVGIFVDEWFRLALDFNIKQIGWGYAHETGHMLDIPERTFGETSNNMISKFYDAELCGNNTWGKNDHQVNKIKYLTSDTITNKIRGCNENNQANCKGYLYHSGLNYLIWWDLESINKGYWGKLDNMYRYNSTLATGLSKEEKMVYFSSLIFQLDLGYYFTRWGLTLTNGNEVFDESSTSSKYNELMKSAISKGLIKTNSKKKFWYVDNNQYKFNAVKVCYANQYAYNIQIEKVIKKGTQYILTLPKVSCVGHLGFEIYESTKLIDFTYSYSYTDKNTYNTGYTPKYKIIAYDRGLNPSKASSYQSYTNSVSLKLMNLNNLLKEN